MIDHRVPVEGPLTQAGVQTFAEAAAFNGFKAGVIELVEPPK
jgi:hypothetical protein